LPIKEDLLALSSEPFAICCANGLTKDDEKFSHEAIKAYHKIFEVPLCDDMIKATTELYRWWIGSLWVDLTLVGWGGGQRCKWANTRVPSLVQQNELAFLMTTSFSKS
jgi:hypothetical protein